MDRGLVLAAAPACYIAACNKNPEVTMRIFAFFAVALFLGGSQASAWEEYNYLDQGVAIQFPTTPEMTKSTYDSILAKGLPATVYSAEDDHVVYKLTIIDLTSRPDAGANFLNDAAFGIIQTGNVLFTDFTRVYFDERAVHGVTIVVDRPDGSRVRDSLFYHRGRMYIAEAKVLPERGDKDMTIPSRYDQTIRFPPDGRF